MSYAISGKERPEEPMNYETIQLEMLQAVGLLTLNRPDKLNALTVEVARDFQSAVGAPENGRDQSSSRALVERSVRVAICARCKKSLVAGRLEAFLMSRFNSQRSEADQANPIRLSPRLMAWLQVVAAI
jgi:NMD protein affecting ribosome stability and mRNA decay